METPDRKPWDVVIVGGGPAGLSAALVLGRARRRVLLVDDAEKRRNAKAEHLHGFVTRDGTPPLEFRRIGREQLRPYDVTVRDARVQSITGAKDAFRVTLDDLGEERARAVVLATGVVDTPLDVPGMREAWGRSVFQCPHCHGWERRERAWGVVLPSAALAAHGFIMTSWTRDLTVFTHGAFALPAELAERYAAAGVRVEAQPLRRVNVGAGGALSGVELADGRALPLDVLFTMPHQAQPPLVQALGLALDEAGYVRVNELQETSVPGLYAAGDLTTFAQAALLAAAAGARAGYALVGALVHPPR